MVETDDSSSKGQGFDTCHLILDGCHDFAPTGTRLTFNTLLRLMVGRWQVGKLGLKFRLLKPYARSAKGTRAKIGDHSDGLGVRAEYSRPK